MINKIFRPKPRPRKTKIICTIGPSSSDPEIMTKMIDSGMNIARFNLSHGDHDEYRNWAKTLRQIAKEKNKPFTLLCDLQGPKIRLGNLPHDQKTMVLNIGDKFRITNREICQSGELTIHYEKLYEDTKVGERILVDDGKVELKIDKKEDKVLYCHVTVGGEIAPFQGVNLPETSVSLPALSPKDLVDLKFVLEIEADAIGLSFTRSGEDIERLREKMARFKPSSYKKARLPYVVAKIERCDAVTNIDSVIEEADAVMVARGDLGLEMPETEVPLIQKQVIEKCINGSKPVATATQMLESMKENPRPTRAEVSDVANAIIDGSDCVMLSGETTTGKYPLEAVLEMKKIIEETEEGIFENKGIRRFTYQAPENFKESPEEVTDSIGVSVWKAASELNAKCIVCITETGYTARAVAKCRGETRIIALTPSEQTYRELGFVWGVEQYMIPSYKTTDELLTKAINLVKENEIVKKGDILVITAGHPVGAAGTTNLIKIEKII